MTDKPNKNTAQFWDDLYQRSGRKWSGRPNQPLVSAVESLKPGKALDLGCGEGGDAVWLAQNGWEVTATDVSAVAIARTKDLATENGVRKMIDLQIHDFEVSFPAGTYDLVSAQYLQTPLEFQRDKVLQKAAAAVAPGGILIIVEHAAAPSWSDHHDHKFPTADETFASLELSPSEWKVVSIGSPERKTTSPSGEAASIKDNVIIVKRLNA